MPSDSILAAIVADAVSKHPPARTLDELDPQERRRVQRVAPRLGLTPEGYLAQVIGPDDVAADAEVQRIAAEARR